MDTQAPTKPSTYIQVEAVNIYPAVFDTNQLSVIRGSSFLLKEAIDCIAEEFHDTLEPLSTGASSGLFRVKDENSSDVLQHIVALLNGSDAERRSKESQSREGRSKEQEQKETKCGHPERYRLFTFVVEECTCASLQEAKVKLSAKIRRRQLRTITRVPDKTPADGEVIPCGAEGVRVATKGLFRRTISGQGTSVSESVAQRLDYGREKRSNLYAHEILNPEVRDRLDRHGFTADLETLASNRKYPLLNNKIAVIYLDGNRFGAIQRDLVRTYNDQQASAECVQRAFDKNIQHKRRRFLTDLLDELMPNHTGASWFKETTVCPKPDGPEDPTQKSNTLCFETLLWGGDEMTIVVPAWLGLDVLQFFYKCSGDWRFTRNGRSQAQLTHAGGIVFCHAKTPITRMRALAMELAEWVKAYHQRENTTENTFDFVVLESIDYPTEPTWEAYLVQRYGELCRYRQPLRPAPAWDETRERLADLLSEDGLSKGQVYRIAQQVSTEEHCRFFEGLDNPGNGLMPWETPPAGQALTPFEQTERRLIEVARDRDGLCARLKSVAPHLGGDRKDQRERAWFWVHLAELWDYLVPVRDKETG